MKRSGRGNNAISIANGVESALPDIVERTAPAGTTLPRPDAGLATAQPLVVGARPAAGPLAEPKTPRHPTHEEIERRAYELYLARGGRDGSAIDDWCRAERELTGAGPLDPGL